MGQEIDSFQDKFEDLVLNIDKINIDIYSAISDGVMPTGTPFSNIWEDVIVHHNDTYRNIVGKIMILFKNQRDGDKAGISMEVLLRIDSTNNSTASIFNKCIQYLFDWLEKYVSDNRIVGFDGQPFIVPHFLYSKEHFLSHFPEEHDPNFDNP